MACLSAFDLRVQGFLGGSHGSLVVGCLGSGLQGLGFGIPKCLHFFFLTQKGVLASRMVRWMLVTKL